MKCIQKEAILVFVFIYACSPALYSQTNNPKFLFGVGAGTLIYLGDLTPASTGSYKTIKPVINFFAGKYFSPFFSARVNVALGSLKGDDARYSKPEYRRQRNFNFHTPVTELSLTAEWNFLGRNYRDRGFSPYVFAGAGYSFLRIKRDWSHLNTEYFSSGSELMEGLAEDAGHVLPRGIVVLPVGVGARYFLSEKIGVSAETSYRITSTDYLDGFSQAANPARKDSYYSHTIGVVYRIGKKNLLDCPVIRY